MERQLTTLRERAESQQQRANSQQERSEIQQERIDLAARATRGRSPRTVSLPETSCCPLRCHPGVFDPLRGRQSPAKCGALQGIPLEGPPGFEPGTNGL